NLGSGAPILTPLAFDATVTSLLLPLLSGKFVRLLPEDEQLETLANDQVIAGGFSLLKVTPAQLDLFSKLGAPAQLGELAHCLVIGGEVLHDATIAPWRQHAPEIRLINEYGPTETVVGCIIHEVGPDQDVLTIPIGRPIWNTRIYVLDAGLEPVPAGV